MALNIVSLIGQYLTPDIVGKFAGLLGGNSGLAQKALGAAVPSVLSGLLSAASKPEGADALNRALASQDTGVLDNIGSLLSGNTSSFTNAGGDALSSILGSGRMGALAKGLSEYAGVPEAGSSQLLGAVGPLVLAAIGKEAKSQHLDAKGTLGMLMDQKDNIARVLPADFASKLGGAGLFDAISDKLGAAGTAAAGTATRAASAATATARPVVDAARKTAAPVTREVVKAGTPWWYYALPLLALALLGWWFLGRSEPVAVVEEEVEVETTETVAPAEPAPAPAATTEATTEAAAPATEAAAPAASLMIGDTDAGALVTTAFTDLTASLKGITDAATAETALPKLTEIRDGLTGLEAPLAGAADNVKSGLKTLVAASLPALETASNAALGNAAVKGVIGTVLEEIVAKLKAFAA